MYFLLSLFIFFTFVYENVVFADDKETEEFMKEQIEWQENIDDATEEDGNAELEDVKIEGSDEEDEEVEGDYELEEAEPEEVMKIHEDLQKIMTIDDGWVYKDVFRALGYGTVFILYWIVDGLENSVDKIITLNGFYDAYFVGELIDTLQPFILGLFLITLIVVGIMLQLNKIEKRQDLIVNILIAVSMFVVIPNLFPLLSDAMKEGIDLVKDRSSLSEEVIKINIADLKLYAENDFNYGEEGGLPQPEHPHKSDVGKSNLRDANNIEGLKFSPFEKIDLFEENTFWVKSDWYDDMKENHPKSLDVLGHKTTYDGNGDDTELYGLQKNLIPGTEVGRESYYRYGVNWGTIITTLSILGFALAITIIKMARIIFDLAFHMIFSLFVASTDITGGQRIKKMIVEIVSSFAVFFVMVLILKIFVEYANWLVGMKTEIGTIPYLLMLLGGTWALLDAPDIVQRLLGIDAGLRSGWQAMAGAYAASKGLSALPKMGGHAMDALNKGAGFVSGMKPALDGMKGKSPSGNGQGQLSIPSRPSRQREGRSKNLIPETPNKKRNRKGNGRNKDNSLGLEDEQDKQKDVGNEQMKSQDPSSSRTPQRERKQNDINEMSSDGMGHPKSPSSGESTESQTDSDMSDEVGVKRSNDQSVPRSDSGQTSMDQPSSSSRHRNKGGSGSSHNRKFNTNGQGNQFIPSRNMSQGNNRPSVNGQRQSSFVSSEPNASNPYFKDTVFGGSRRGRERAVQKARMYNTGVRMRERMSRFSSPSAKTITDVGSSSSANPVKQTDKDIKVYRRKS